MRCLSALPGVFWVRFSGAVLLLSALALLSANGQALPPGQVPPTNPPQTPPTQLAQPAPAESPQDPLAQEPSLSPERFGAVGGDNVALATPNMIGDFIGPNGSITLRDPSGVTRSAVVPLVARGAFKIAENESPRPVDRVYINYNYFSGLGENDGSSNIALHRETIGFEKTCLDGNASIGMRLPFIESSGAGNVGSGVGDLDILLKYAVINNRETGDVLSGGVVVTAPTGRSDLFFLDNTNIHDTLIQPWLGYIFNLDDWYVHGFTSLVVPTDSRDETILFNDVGVGYWLYRSGQDQLITAVAPTLEAHVATPLDHRHSTTDPIVLPDWVVLTAGCSFNLHQRSTLTVGVATPVTGPQPFDLEAIVQLNFRF